jgi:phenylalanyl-tRNA synthetase beta chain
MSPCETEYLRKGFALELSIAKEPAGLFGIVRPEIAEEWRFQEPVAVAELALNPLVQHIFDVPSIHDIPAYPPVERDMALIVDQHTQHEEIMNIIRAHAPPELEDIRLFDIFTGKSIGTGKKSMAYALSYRSSNRTLTDEETNRYHNGVKGALQKTLDIQIREN